MNKKFINVSILGKPNAGKSELLNSLLGQKISAVTYKSQTTRRNIKGIICEGDVQIIFTDSPGIFSPKNTLEKSIVKRAWMSISQTHLVLILVDIAKPLDETISNIITKIKLQKLDFIIVLNKIDKETIDPETETKALAFTDNVMKISAKRGDNLPNLIEVIKNKADEIGWLYPEDQITDVSSEFIAQEITREQLYLNLDHEIPYKITVSTDLWKEQGGKTNIYQSIIVSTTSCKKIIIGERGSFIKKIGILARAIIQKELEIKASLFLFVKIRPDWEKNPMYNN
jgi:GTP-binding protein Era